MKLAFLFPGQGSQHAGMGKDIFEKFSEARSIFERADAALGFPLSRLCFDGPEEELKRTANTQPAVLTVSAAVHAVLEKRGARPLAAAGHSLGEYSAYVAAGTLRFEDAVRAVRARGEAMQKACPEGQGDMAAVMGLDLASVEAVCREEAQGQVLSPANVNSPAQIVVAGHKAAVERAVRRARREGAKRAVPLAVSAPFHCALMKPAQEAMREILSQIEFRDPAFPVLANVTARPVTSGEEARKLLVEQVTAPVRWADIADGLQPLGVECAVEVGPGSVLTGLQRRAHRCMECLHMGSVGDVEKWLARGAAG
jgi:[acyl-carrier-protein] S-malonyltransferase